MKTKLTSNMSIANPRSLDNLLFLDCSSGVAGNMLIGALLSVGLDFEQWAKELAKLGLSRQYTLKVQKQTRQGTAGFLFTVKPNHVKQPHRGFHEIQSIIQNSRLSTTVKKRSIFCFKQLATAEATVHGIPINAVHFHEVGAIDAIVDIVGFVIGLDMLKVITLLTSAVNVGGGTVHCEHGILPVPAPATQALLESADYPYYTSNFKTELTTPTGATLITALAKPLYHPPIFTIQKRGVGFGHKNIPGLTGLHGSLGSEFNNDILVLQTNIDDMDPRIYDYVMDLCFAAGALDVTLRPIMMKKNRPAIQLEILSPPSQLDVIGEILFRETTTLGFRYWPAERMVLERHWVIKRGKHDEIMVKVGRSVDKIYNQQIEYTPACNLARKTGIPLKVILSK